MGESMFQKKGSLEFYTTVSKLILWGTLIVLLAQARITMSILGKGS
jgi:hypothetical protein